MINKLPTTLVVCTLLSFFFSSFAIAEDEKKESKSPKTVTVKAEPLSVKVTLKGVFEAVETSEISIRPEVWSGLSVESAAGHGDQVKADDAVLNLDTKKIDVAIEDLELQISSAQLAFEQAESSLEALRKSVPQELESAKRAADEAEENMQRFIEIEREESIKDIEQQLKSTRNGLMYQKEELEQLERMYKADDLTEETEEIILTRAQHGVDAAKYRLKKAIAAQDRFLNVVLPRQAEDFRHREQQAALALEKAEFMLPASIKDRELALAKQQVDLEKMERKLAHMVSDRKLLTLHAPHAGTVYYGQAVRGQWPDATAKEKALVSGSSVSPGAVVMTIVRNEDLVVRATIEEKQLSDLNVGDDVVLTPSARPHDKVTGSLKQISPIPVSPGKFDAEIDVELDRFGGGIVAGMACKAVIEVYKHPNAILVPAKAVGNDGDEDEEFVYLVDKEGEKEQQQVRTGRHVGDRVEILKGLKPGDEILAKNPD
jgi:multidrug efflux pump subunit AcrA (membrane-fusion protein)